jgi:hypothetical protein
MQKMKNLIQSMVVIAVALCGTSNANAQTQAKTSSNIKLGGMNEMPSTLRTSMTGTVGKQTLAIAISEEGGVVSIASQAYNINTTNKTITGISQSEFKQKELKGKQTNAVNFGDRVNAGLQQAGSVVSGAAGMLGGAMPGASIVSAALSSGSSMVNGGASSAAYAATGRSASWTLNGTDTKMNLPENLPDGDYELTFVIVEYNKGGLKDTLKTQVRMAFTMVGNVVTKHDTAKNSISNVR